MNFLRKIYPKSFKRVILALILVMAVTSITMGAVYDAALKNVTLIQIDEFNGTEESDKISTRKITVGEFLTENAIIVGGNDVVSMSAEAELSEDNVLIIRKGRIVELSIDGKVEIMTVTKPTVGEALEEMGITLSAEDVVTPSRETPVTNELSVIVDRYSTEFVYETEAIGFTAKNVNDSTLAKGKTKVAQEGQNGEKTVKYSVKKKNGEIISKDYVSEEITKQPVEKIVKVGTKTVKKSTKTASKAKSSSASAAGTTKDFSYSRKLEVSATAYHGSPSENGGHTKTAYGLTPKFGVVAVDPKVIPLGTKLYIESPDGGKSWTYGYCIAGDTGGAIKGNKVDLCFNTRSECINFGRKKATVYVLN